MLISSTNLLFLQIFQNTIIKFFSLSFYLLSINFPNYETTGIIPCTTRRLLGWIYISCLRMYVHAHVSMCVRACVRACVRTCAYARTKIKIQPQCIIPIIFNNSLHRVNIFLTLRYSNAINGWQCDKRS